MEGLERLESFGAFAGWQTAALKAHRKPLLWPGRWGSGLGPGVPVGEGGVAAFAGWQTAALKASRKSLLWIWGACWGRCLEGLAGFGRFGAFGEFWRVCGLSLLWPGPGVPVGEVALALALGCLLGEVALALGCMLGKVFGILEVWVFCRLETAALRLIECHCCGPGPLLGGLQPLRAGKRQL